MSGACVGRVLWGFELILFVVVADVYVVSLVVDVVFFV